MWSRNDTHVGILVVFLHCLLRDEFKLSLQKFTCFDLAFSPPYRTHTQKCTHFCLKLQSISTFKLVFHPSISILTSKLVSCVCALCKTLCCWEEKAVPEKHCGPAVSAWAWAALRCWLSILTFCVASDKGTNLSPCFPLWNINPVCIIECEIRKLLEMLQRLA